MEPLTLADVARLAGALSLEGGERRTVTGVSTDSRTILPGDLFVALRGDRFDGHRYVEPATEHGAGALLVEGRAAVPAGVPVVRVEDTRAALARLAAGYRARFDLDAIAITGSVGKTTTKAVLAHLLGGEVPTVASPKSFNNAIGVPLTLLEIDRSTRALVAELGASAPGEIDRLAALVRPDLAVITAVREAHLEGFGSLESIRAAKGELLGHAVRAAILNADDEATPWFRERFAGRVVTFGFAAGADVRIVRVVEHEDALGFRLRIGERVVEGRIGLVGRHQIGAVAAAIAVSTELGFDPTRAAARLSGFHGVPGRLRRVEAGPVLLYDDSYNASPAAVREAVGFVARRIRDRRLVVVLGDMLELGPRSAAIHRALGHELGGRPIDLLVPVGPGARLLAEEARKASGGRIEVEAAADALEAVRLVTRRVGPGDCVLVKGSRGIGLERVVAAIHRLHRSEDRTRRLETVMS